MLDSQLIRILRAEIEAGAVASFPSLAGTPVIQKAQPTQQGSSSGPSLYLEKIDDAPRHWPMSKFGLVDGVFTEEVTQLYESVYQISSLFLQLVGAPIVITASDLANQVMMWFLLPSTIARLRKQNIGILRVTKVRNEKFEDDEHKFEAHPSFDLTITNDRTLSVTTPKVTTIDGTIHSV